MDRNTSFGRLRAYAWRPVVITFGVAATLVVSIATTSAAPDANENWRTVTSSSGNNPAERHEAAGASVNGKLYVLGGRGSRPVDVFDVGDDSWSTAAPAPVQFHHFQAAVIGTDIYVIGAFVGQFPNETPVGDIHVLDTVANEWRVEGSVPNARRRGSAATAVRDGWIYIVGGNTLGHNGGAVPWFDRYQPSTGAWETLPDAPEARDHHGAAWVGDSLVTSGGRQSEQPNTFVNTIGPTDIWDGSSWRRGAPIPTQRAGAMTIGFESELIVAGGESATRAHDAVEAFNVNTGGWRTLEDMNQQRHSGGAAVVGTKLHVVAGAATRGGSSEINSHETLALDSGGQADQDGDGLSDVQETEDFGTDPFDYDTDDDQLSDGEEATLGTDPLSADSDEDGLDDHEETIEGTDPLAADSDDDDLDDKAERDAGTDPLSADSDEDGLSDGTEVNELQTDPLEADTDEDGLDDGVEVDTTATNPLLADTDEDGLDDLAEVEQWGTDPTLADTDDDGLGDEQEVEAGTDPLSPDSDLDGLSDAAEIDLGLDPLVADTDEDGLDDGAEVELGSDPLDADSDDDGLSDSEEVSSGTNPTAADSDGDTLDDAHERDAGTDPLLADTDADGISDADDAEPLTPARRKGGGAVGLLSMALLLIGVFRQGFSRRKRLFV